MPDILSTILERKRAEVAKLRQGYSASALRERAEAQSEPRGFRRRLAQTMAAGHPAVIAEIKQASPSRGLIRRDFDPAAIATAYQQGGAACLSVLTDADFFQGGAQHLKDARNACQLPVLRKDFMIDPLQVLEARAIGADCVLLIAAALSVEDMQELASCATGTGMDVLVEVHSRAELETVITANLLPQVLLGINNRDLRNFEVRLETTLELLPLLPQGTEVVTESGITAAPDIAHMQAAGVHRFLVGEALMRESDPGATLAAMLG